MMTEASSHQPPPRDSARDAVQERAGASAAQGLPVADFARRHALSEAEVWRRLRAGELLGRTERGRLLVLDEGRVVRGASAGEPDAGDLPPLPDEPAAASAALTVGAVSSSGTSSEVALLLDHLSLAKEENREILQMTQSAIRKVTELTDAVVAMKNAVIEAKDTQIDALKEQLAAREAHIKQLLQKNEDLEMLTRALAEGTGKP